VDLRDLNVLHWRGAHVAANPALQSASGQDLWLIDTCQRRVAVLTDPRARASARREFPDGGMIESFEGAEAYAFLLRFACGLESKLIAETEIFGQVKQAWRSFSERGSPLARQLSPWVQLLFQDVKAIRAQYLGHLGSASYGSQVRRLLGDDAEAGAAAGASAGAAACAPAGATLLIGAGHLAQSVAPWLSGAELWLCNRTTERARELGRELSKRQAACPVRVIEGGFEAELDAWRRARHVIVCIPSDAQKDCARVAARRAGPHPGGRVIHLGLGAAPTAPWDDLPGVVSLGSLFEMLRSHSQLRARQLQRARHACLEKAVLRSLGATASHPHSWEDLAAFQTL
jgi:Glutamyl-tRNAGlu reductase, N-terminal domain